MQVQFRLLTLFALCLSTLTPLAHGQGLDAVQGSWRRSIDSTEAKDQIYFTLNKNGESSLTGRRVPQVANYVRTVVTARVEDNQVRGEITYIDTKDGSPWAIEASAPKALWEFTLDGDKLTGRWEQILVDFDAPTADKLVESRTWVDRELVRVPRFGGYAKFGLEEIKLPSSEDLSGFAAAAFEGLYVTPENEIVEVKASGKELTMTLGKHTYTLTTGRPQLFGSAQDCPVDCSLELTVAGNSLVGRVGWKDYDKAYDTVVQKGWSPVNLERLVHSGPKSTQVAAEALTGNITDLDSLEGDWRYGRRSFQVSKNADNTLTLTLKNMNLQPFTLDGGVLKAVEEIGVAKLQWELTLEGDKLVGRRQWIMHRPGSGEALKSGWVAVSMIRVPKPVVVADKPDPVTEKPDVTTTPEKPEDKPEDPPVKPEDKPEDQPVEPETKPEDKPEDAPVKPEQPEDQPEKPEDPPVPVAPVEPVLFGFKEGDASDDSFPEVAEGKARKIAGTWKFAKGRYLKLRRSGDDVTGLLRWDGKSFKLSGTVSGDNVSLTWKIEEPEAVELGLKASLPRKNKLEVKLQWVSKRPGGEVVESGWVALTARKLRRLG